MRKRHLRQVVDTMRLTGNYEAHRADFNAELMRILSESITRTITFFGLEIVRQLKPSTEKSIVDNPNFNFFIAEWIQRHLAASVASMTGTFFDDIAKVIAAGLQEQSTLEQITEEIINLNKLEASRARTIARTETHNAAMYAQESTARQVQVEVGIVLKKKWIAANDERTRANHFAMRGSEAIPFDMDFVVGGVRMSRPGDPRGGASNNINCRCAVVFEEDEQDDD
jgi:hypothetical protein